MSYKNFDIFKVKEAINIAKHILNIGIIACAFLSLAYLIYWGTLISDDIIYESTKHIFAPLANFFFPNETDFIIYRNTAYCFAALIIPHLIAYCFMDKIEEEAKKTQAIIEEKETRRIIEQAKKDKEFEYDVIKNYSICLSIDFEGEKNISKESKYLLNKTIFKKLDAFLRKIDGNVKISISDVLILTSGNFEKYDLIYSLLIKALAKIRENTECKYNIKLIPSITTDAFCTMDKLNTIRQSHFEIQSFNHKNRALTSGTFARKYKHLKHNKYAGIPIGEYAFFKDENIDTYELNVVHKNLTATLDSLK